MLSTKPILPALAMALLAASCGGPASPPAAPPPSPPVAAAPVEAGPSPWTDVARQAGITEPLISGSPAKDFIIEAKGGGACFFDYDGDGDQDLYVVNGATREMVEKVPGAKILTDHLYRNDGDWTFTDVTRQAGVGDTGWGYGCVAGDYDNDGDQDIYVANVGPNTLYRNNGDGTFRNVTRQAGVDDDRYSTSAAWGDYDKDGDLDLYVANFVVFTLDDLKGPPHACDYRGTKVMCGPLGLGGYPDSFFRNNGDGTFTDVTRAAGLMEKEPYYGFTPIFEDFDLNGTLDLFVPNDSCPNYLYRNLGNGRFVEEGVMDGVAYSEDGRSQASMGVAVGDYDADGLMDIFLTHWYGDYNTLYHNEGSLRFTDLSYESGLAAPSLPMVSWGTFFFDYDNDGDLDLFVANGHTYPHFANDKAGYKQPNMLFLNDGQGHFENASARMGEDFLRAKVSRGAAYADIDEDGDLDIFVTELDEPPTLLRNNLDNGNHHLAILLRGTKSNRDALGSRLEIVAGGKHQYWSIRSGGSFLSDNDRHAFFGLGKNDRVESLKVTWPTGAVQEWHDLAVDQSITITEGSAGFVVRKPPAAAGDNAPHK